MRKLSIKTYLRPNKLIVTSIVRAPGGKGFPKWAKDLFICGTRVILTGYSP